jgi:serine/threonine protein kinase
MGLQYNTAIDIWSLGCICVELFRGIPLFPGNCEYNQLRLIINLLGLPPKEMIEQGRHSHKYFTPVYEPDGNYTYRFKSKHEFEAEQGFIVPDLNFQEELTCIDDLVNFQSVRNEKIEIKQCFVDFIKGLLMLDPRSRWTPSMTQQHPFISRKKYEGPFVPKRETNLMMRSIPVEDHEENSDSSSISRKNRSDEMYDKLGSCPSQLLRDPTDNIFNKFSKKGISESQIKEMMNNKSYRPPIISLEVDYFKGFNFNSLDAISERFKDMIYNQRK